MEKIFSFILNNKLMVNLAIILIVVGGVLSISHIRQESFPATDIDTLIVRVIYPGASARDLELNAIVPIEEKIDEINGIKEYLSHSMDNTGTIYIYLEDDLKNPQKVKDEIFRKLNKNSIEDLPDEVEDIIITDLNPKISPVVTVAVVPNSMEDVHYRRALDYTDTLVKQIRRLDGVSGVVKSGYQDREMHINIDPDKLNKYEISLNEVVAAIQSRNVRASGGTLQSMDHEMSIITIGKFKEAFDVSDVIIRNNDLGYKTRIRDVAKITESFGKPDILIRINGKQGILLDIKKKEEADIVKTAERVKELLDEIKDRHPDGIQVSMVNDTSRSISSLLNVVVTNALMGFVVVLVMLVFFLDIRTAFWTAFGIPISLAMVLITMNIFGLSFNMISLAAIITVLGMMVDHGIIISEIIYEKQLQGISPYKAVIEGVQEVYAPVSITVITTILAFIPLLAITGIMGKFIVVFPVMISTTLFASFIEATLFLPVHLLGAKPSLKHIHGGHWFDVFSEIYGRLLGLFLRFRYFVFILFMGIFIAVGFSSLETIKNFVLVYDDSSEQILITVESPEGISLDRMSGNIALVEKKVQELVDKKNIVSVVSTVGNSDTTPFFSQGNQSNRAKIALNLTPASERKVLAKSIETLLKENISIKTFPMFNSIHIKEMIIGPPVGEPVNIRVISDDEEIGSTIAGKIKKYLKGVPGVFNIADDYKHDKKELNIEFNYDAMSMAGITVSDVARTVRIAYEGTEASAIRLVKDEISYKVQVNESLKKDRSHLENLLIANRQNRLVRLKNIARIVEATSVSGINHYNGDRVISVTATLDTDKITSARISSLVMDQFKHVSRDYPGTYLIIGGEAKETMKTFGGLSTAFTMAVIFIYFIMIILFKSFTQPFLIMLTIPFGITGSLIAFNIHHMPMSFLGIIGIIGLAGVVVNDSVVMVDFINKVLKENDNERYSRERIYQSIVTGAKQRLRPVILTTLTTVAGLLPTVYGIGGKASIIVPAVMALTYGLMFATLLTLIFIPAVFLINEDVQSLYRTIKGFFIKDSREKDNRELLKENDPVIILKDDITK